MYDKVENILLLTGKGCMAGRCNKDGSVYADFGFCNRRNEFIIFTYIIQ